MKQQLEKGVEADMLAALGLPQQLSSVSDAEMTDAEYQQAIAKLKAAMDNHAELKLMSLIPSKEESETKRIERLVADKVRKVLFQELGLDGDGIKQHIATLCDRLVSGHVKSMLDTTKLQQLISESVQRTVRDTVPHMIPVVVSELVKQRVDQQVPESHIRETVTQRLGPAIQARVDSVVTVANTEHVIRVVAQRIESEGRKAAEKAADEFIRNNLRITLSAKNEPSAGRKIITS